MEPLMLGDIASFCAARSVEIRPDAVIRRISTDSRAIEPGDLFIPLIGERFDGHRYISEARRRGAIAVLSSESGEEPDTLYVGDTLQAYMSIARQYRARMTLPVVAVTGSVGKTTTKEMIAAVLSQFFNTHKTEGNLNNHIGVPASVLGIEHQHGVAVLEMGMNHFGELHRLSEIAAPDMAVITNIGVAHIEFLGSREGILKAKLEILDGLRPGGTVLLNGDEPLLYAQKGRLPFQTSFFGVENPEADYRAERIEQDGLLTRFDLIGPFGRVPAELPAVGVHNVYNALAAVAVGTALGCAIEGILRGLRAFQTVGTRQRIENFRGYTIIDDSYNANTDSMLASLRVLWALQAEGKKIAVLGDMLELGEHADAEHRKVGAAAVENCDVLLLVGRQSTAAFDEAMRLRSEPDRAFHFETREQLAEKLRALARPGDAILFKGSRGMQLEKVKELFLEERHI